jgi:hypothetical protein
MYKPYIEIILPLISSILIVLVGFAKLNKVLYLTKTNTSFLINQILKKYESNFTIHFFNDGDFGI